MFLVSQPDADDRGCSPIFHARFACIFATGRRRVLLGGDGAVAAPWWIETVKSCRYSQDVRQRCKYLCTIFVPIALHVFRTC